MGLKIEISSNLKIVNFLDLALNLNENSYKLFRKTNAIPTYINFSTNHPASIVQQLPNAINIRINRLSSSKNIFNCHKEFYNEALHNSSYKNELKYLESNRHKKNRSDNIENNDHKNRGNNIGNNRTNDNINMDNKISKNINKNRRRNIFWFNRTFCNSSNINKRKYFLVLINKHFKDDEPFRKIINKNNGKIKYFRTDNMQKIIDNNNMKLMNKLNWNNNNNNNIKDSYNWKI